MTSEQSKGLVATAFESWAEGDGDFFSISPTIFHGPLRVHRRSRARTRAAGISSGGGHSTYRRAFVATDSAHGGEDHYGGKHGRRALGWSCGGEGRPGYDNRYCWVMRMEHGTVKEAVAFFDSAALTDLLECVSP